MMATRRVMILSVILMAATFWLHFGLSYGQPVRIHRSLHELPHTLGEWSGSDLPLSRQLANVLGVDTYINRIYRRNDRILDLYIGYYETQRQGDTIHSPKNCLPGAGWNIIGADQVRIPLASQASGPLINRYIVQHGMERQMVFYWYQCRGRVITNDYLSRIYLVIDAVSKRRTDGSIIRISLPITDETEEAEAEALRQGLNFTQQIFPELSKFIPN